jgi:pyridoxamine 5'-phosphate oxidase
MEQWTSDAPGFQPEDWAPLRLRGAYFRENPFPETTAMTDPVVKTIAELRCDYHAATLRRADLAASPFDHFSKWFGEALAAGLREPNALTLSTIGLDGFPNSRTLLMKDFGEDGVTIFTNYTSRKGRELEAHPVAALLFLWKELERQVHVRGRVEKTSREESQAYFFSRPYASRIGAWSSTQSAVIPDRAWLDSRAAEFEARFPDTGAPDCVPLPDFWGGYRVIPESIEFWQGQPGRKHDRFIYRRETGTGWTIERLSP